MESVSSPKRPSHREWRRLAKKERRKRLRQLAAREQAEEADQLERRLEASADYLRWLELEDKLQEQREARERQQHESLEKAWQEAEVSLPCHALF